MTADEIVCVVCGGRGGWWSCPPDIQFTADGFRETCPRCQGTGWEPSEVVRRLLAQDGAQ